MKETFVGRDRELQQLTETLEEACDGSGRMSMISGGAGIGKTRLVEALEKQALDRGIDVYWGGCLESGIAPPYWPWIEALRTCIERADADTIGDAMGRGGGVIAELIPELRSLVADLPEPVAIGDPNSSRFRLFDALASFLRKISNATPIVLVLEDLHWADQSSLELLEFVAHSLASSRLYVVGTHRDGEVQRDHPLHHALGDLNRERPFETVHLNALGVDSVRKMIEGETGLSPSMSLATEIHTVTEGNALYVTEMIRSLMQQRGPADKNSLPTTWDMGVPAGIREAIGRRLATLSDECIAMLKTAAIMGKGFTVDLLGRINHEATTDRIIELLDEALQYHVICNTSKNAGFEFTHALMRETLIEEMSLLERVKLHANAATTLESLYGDDADAHASEVARHSVEAESILGREKVAHYSLLAGEQAIRRFAWEEARAHFQRGLAAKTNVEMDDEKARLIFGLARMEHMLVVELQPKNDRFDMVKPAYDHFVARGLTDEAVQVAIAGFERTERDGTTTMLTDDALSYVEPGTRDEGLLLCLRAGVLIDSNEIAAAETSANRARVIGESLGDSRLLLRVYSHVATIRRLQQRLDEARAFGQMALHHATAVDDVRGISSIMWDYVWLSLKSGLAEDARHWSSRLKEHAGTRDPAYVASANWLVAIVANRTGDWATAIEALDQILPKETNIHWLGAIKMRFSIAQELGNPETAGISIQEIIIIVKESIDQGDITRAIGGIGGLIGLALSTGDCTHIDEIEAMVNTLIDDARPYQNDWVRTYLSWVSREWLENISIIQNNTAVAAGHFESRLSDGPLDPKQQPLLGGLAHTAGRLDDAVALFDELLRFDRKGGYFPRTANHCHDYAAVLVDRAAPVSDGPSDIDRASGVLEEGLSIAKRLGMVLLQEKIVALQERIAQARSGDADSDGNSSNAGSAETAGHPGGLSDREVEVIHFVVKGFTNKEIAGLMHISANTVAAHLKHVYRKTGCANRAEAGVYAERRGLLA